jgi:hypothetical protein
LTHFFHAASRLSCAGFHPYASHYKELSPSAIVGTGEYLRLIYAVLGKTC